MRLVINRHAILLVLLLILPVAAAHGSERLSNGFTQSPDASFRAGFWWSSNDPGWGIDLHLSGDVMIGTWATYDESGQPTWYLGVGRLENDRWVMPLSAYRWQEQALSEPQAVGQLELSFADGYHATMEWTLGERSGEYAIEPFVFNHTPLAEDRTGFWFETAQPGYGASVVTQGPILMAVLYHYDENGDARWVWADNLRSGDSGELDLLRFTGACPNCDRSEAVSSPAGNASLSFNSENHGVLDARVSAAQDSQPVWEVRDRTINLLSNRASGRAQAFQLVPFITPELLRDYLGQGLEDGTQYGFAPGFVNFSPAIDAEAFSTTNLQESAVDEADVVKTDGQFIYALDKGQVDQRPHRIRVMRRAEDGLELVEEAIIEVGEGTEAVDGLYLLTERAEGLPDLLITVLGGEPLYYWPTAWFAPYPWVDTTTELYFHDVSDPTQPQLLSRISLDGTSIETRRIGESLFLVSRYLPTAIDVEPALATLAELLPMIRIDDQEAALVDPLTTLLPPQPPGFRYVDLVTISRFDLADLESLPQTQTFVGLSEAVYVSENNVFISSSRFGQSVDPGFGGLAHSGELMTDIHQFSLAEGGLSYAGSGVVEGYLSHGGTSPSFSFSEFDGHLRVVTSSGFMWGNFGGGNHRVSVMRLADQDSEILRQVGFIPNAQRPEPLGKPGELLYGLRFLGERLYAVTFKSIDPLYVVDLSRPADPRIQGEIEITGFSDYLHPLPGELLIGFGKEAIPDDGFGDGNFAWYQGLQLSLFDIADPSQPRLLRRFELGRRGSSSSLLEDHHAFSYLPADVDSGRDARITVPVVLHDASDPSQVSPDPDTWYDWQLTGLAMFDLVQTPGLDADLVSRNIMVSHRRDSDPEHEPFQDSLPQAARGLITDQAAYFYLRGDLYSAPWGQAEAVTGPH
jgi:hypothetical protein